MAMANDDIETINAWRRSVHECGHVLVALRLDDPFQVQSADIICNEALGRGGVVVSALSPSTVDHISALKIATIYGGGCAAEVLVFKEFSKHARSDIKRMREILIQLEPEDAALDLLGERCIMLSFGLLRGHEPALRRLAEALTEQTKLSRPEIIDIVGIVPGHPVRWKEIWEHADMEPGI